MENFWLKTLQPLCLAVAAIAGIVSSWQGIIAKDNAAKAEAAALSAKQSADQLASQREDLKVERDYQVQVTTMALGSLKDGDARAQMAMVGLVGTLPNTDLGQKLTLALTTSANPGVRQEAGRNLEAVKSFETQQHVDANASAGTAGKVAVGPSVGATRQLTVAPNPNGWDIDIFWCDANPDGLRRARTLGDLLAQRANGGVKLGGETLGRVRVRPLPVLVNQRPQYQIFSDLVGPDAKDPAERRFAGVVADLAKAQGVPLAIRPGTKASKWYLSVFYCGT